LPKCLHDLVCRQVSRNKPEAAHINGVEAPAPHTCRGAPPLQRHACLGSTAQQHSSNSFPQPQRNHHAATEPRTAGRPPPPAHTAPGGRVQAALSLHACSPLCTQRQAGSSAVLAPPARFDLSCSAATGSFQWGGAPAPCGSAICTFRGKCLENVHEHHCSPVEELHCEAADCYAMSTQATCSKAWVVGPCT